jgi:DNA repair protein RecO (recombination protein O)
MFYQTLLGTVLAVRPLTESSLVIHWMTDRLGRISTVAKGAKGPKSPFKGKLDLFFSAEFVIQVGRHELYPLKEIELRATREPLRNSLSALQRACYAVRLLEQTTEKNTPIPELFSLFESFFNILSLDPQNFLLILALELKLLKASGLGPDLNSLGLSPGTLQVAKRLLEADWPNFRNLRATELQKKELYIANARMLMSGFGRLPGTRNSALTTTE